MKLLRLIGGLGPEHGGPPVSSVSACIAAQRAGAETTFAFPLAGELSGAPAEAVARLRAEGVRIRHFPYAAAWGRRGEGWGVSYDLARWYRQSYRDFDVVHCHGAWQTATLLAARLSGKGPPLVLTPHESLTDFDIAQSSSALPAKLKKWLRRYYTRRFGLFVMSSLLEARDSLPPGTGGSDRVAVIPHPVYDQSAGHSALDQGRLPSAGLKIGYLGRLHAKKNVDVILRALQELDDTISLSVAGDGPEGDTLKHLATVLGVDRRVDWLGFVDAEGKRKFFHDINILLMPSDYECFGMAAAEAMVNGVPVITTQDTGIAEIIRDHGGGEIVAPKTRALRAAIENLARDSDKIVQLGGLAAKAAHNSLSFAAYGEAMMHRYQTLLAQRKTGGE